MEDSAGRVVEARDAGRAAMDMKMTNRKASPVLMLPTVAPRTVLISILMRKREEKRTKREVEKVMVEVSPGRSLDGVEIHIATLAVEEMPRQMIRRVMS